MSADIPDEERGRVTSSLILATAGMFAVAESVREEHPHAARVMETVLTSYASLVALFWMIMKGGEMNA